MPWPLLLLLGRCDGGAAAHPPEVHPLTAVNDEVARRVDASLLVLAGELPGLLGPVDRRRRAEEPHFAQGPVAGFAAVVVDDVSRVLAWGRVDEHSVLGSVTEGGGLGDDLAG